MSDTATKRYFGWFLPKGGGKVDHARAQQEFSDKHWEEFQRIVIVASELRPFIIDYLSLKNEFEVLSRVGPQIIEAVEGTLDLVSFMGAAQTRGLALAQGVFTNFLGATSSLKYRAKMRLIERYGKDSLEYKKYYASERDCYHASFAYRLFYNLRNFAQHHELPISTIPVEVKRNEKGQPKATMSFVLKPQQLLQSPLINAKFRESELVHLTDEIDLFPLAKEAFDYHGAITRVIIDIFADRLVEMQAYGLYIYKTMKVPTGATPVIWEGTVQPALHYSFSFDELALVVELYAEIKANGIKLGPQPAAGTSS